MAITAERFISNPPSFERADAFGLPARLKTLVHESVAVLGQVLNKKLGNKKFHLVEDLRRAMLSLRDEEDSQARITTLFYCLTSLKKLDENSQVEIGRAFTLMLELINTCENAYRSFRLSESKQMPSAPPSVMPEALVYVLTAHPTEARAPENIRIFQEIQELLFENLKSKKDIKNELAHCLEIAWGSQINRRLAPQVKDEAEHVYGLLFREEIISALLSKSEKRAPLYIRSWVGGDKDGHPGVNEKTLKESLELSRNQCLRFVDREFQNILGHLDLLEDKSLFQAMQKLRRHLKTLKLIKAKDAHRILALKEAFQAFKKAYIKNLGHPHPSFERLAGLFHAFPALVVPMEVRESSDMLEQAYKLWPKLSIYKMLKLVNQISQGSDPKWYVQGFVISMTENLRHIQLASRMQKDTLSQVLIPIIPLFENANALKNSAQIMSEFVSDHELAQIARKNWKRQIEMMVGYSDSSKESGVLASRLAIARALPELEKVCLQAGFKPIFFHGSGGSIDRGGGTIEDQTAWWPKSALKNYKVTVQGEMIERSFSTKGIALRQLEKITEQASLGLKAEKMLHENSVVDAFAKLVAAQYQEAILSPSFLKVVEEATPYLYLRHLKIGSRPAKRTTELTVKGLRAIPWVLCWTQTRVLFQTWWGVGTAWKKSTEFQKQELKEAFKTIPVFASYIKALGFTLAKIELDIFKVYLQESQLSPEEKAKFVEIFEKEYELTKKAYLEICGKNDLMWFRPWLGESIYLRSAMIHPLNLLQIIAIQTGNASLLRLTVTGISSGMMTTG